MLTVDAVESLYNHWSSNRSGAEYFIIERNDEFKISITNYGNMFISDYEYACSYTFDKEITNEKILSEIRRLAFGTHPHHTQIWDYIRKMEGQISDNSNNTGIDNKLDVISVYTSDMMKCIDKLEQSYENLKADNQRLREKLAAAEAKIKKFESFFK